MGNGTTITDTELLQMQAASKKRHRRTMPYKKRKPRVTMAELMAQTLPGKEAIMSYEEVQAKTTPTDTPQTSQQPIIQPAAKPVTQDLKPKKETMPIKQMPVHIPHPGPAKKWLRDEQRVPELPERPQKIQRPPPVYTNIVSSYGIWAEIAAEQLKKSG